MRVMHVITNMMGSGGAEVMLSRLVQADARHRPLVVSLMDIAERHAHLADGNTVTLHRLKARGLAGMGRAVFSLARLIEEERPHAVMCWLYHAMLAGQLAAGRSRLDVPVFWNVRQSLDDPASLSRSTRLAIALARRLSDRPAGIVFNSRRGLETHRRLGFRNAHCHVIPNGFETVRTPAPARLDRPRVLGIAGRLHPQKDHRTFFEAAAAVLRRHPGTRFLAAGAGMTPDNPDLRAMMDETGLPLQSIGLLGNLTDMRDFYRAIDGLVLSSRTEGFANVVAEAMAWGKPVIGTDVGDTALIIGDTGLIVPAGDPAKLAGAMDQFLSLTSDEYARLSRAAKARIDSEYALARVVSLYDDLLRRHAAPAPLAAAS